MTVDPYSPADQAPPADRFDRVPPADEGVHQPGPEDLWGESWYLDAVDPDAGVAAYVRLGLYPNQGIAWYWACLVKAARW